MKTLFALAFPLSLMAASGPLTAQTDDPFANVARVDVIPGWRTAGGTHMAGLRITLAPGWKTYWRAPGDAGIPLLVSWDIAQNIAAAQFHWPTPEVHEQGGMQTYGYSDGFVLPVELSPETPGAPMEMSGELRFGVCEEICIPVSKTFAATLPASGDRDGVITAALLNQPLTADEAGATHVACTINPAEDGLVVTATISMPPLGPDEAVIIEAGNPNVWVSAADVTRNGDQLSATVDMIHHTGGSFAVDRSALRITVLGEEAVDIRGCAAP